MLCEMCGQEVESTSRVRVEGSVLNLCANCARFGVVLEPAPVAPRAAPSPSPALFGSVETRLVQRTRRLEERDLFKELPDMELAPDWNKRIRAAREKLNWTPEELGKRLNEKKSLVLKIEAGHFRPADTMIRKIETQLKIRLRASASDAS